MCRAASCVHVHTAEFFSRDAQNMPRRAPSGGRFAAPCADPPLPICDLNSLWTHAYEKLMAENRRLVENREEPRSMPVYLKRVAAEE